MRVKNLRTLIVTLAMGQIVGVASGEEFELHPVDSTRDACGTVNVFFNQPVDQVITNVNLSGPDLPADQTIRIVRPNGQTVAATVNPSGPNQFVTNSISTGQNEVYSEFATGRITYEVGTGQERLVGQFPPLGQAKGSTWTRVPFGQNGFCVGSVTPFNGQDFLDIICSGETGDPLLWADGSPVTEEDLLFAQSVGESHFISSDEEDLRDAFYRDALEVYFDEELTPSALFNRCLRNAGTLCLQDNRFAVDVEWKTAKGQTGSGMAITGTDDSGEFWFFDPQNTELIVKVLDACNSPFNSYWVFAGGLTNVEVDITVTDTQTDTVKTYSNPLGTAFQPIQDTRAFATCP